MIRQIWVRTPEASAKPAGAKISNSVVVWQKPDGEHYLTVGHASYTPDQAIRLAAAILDGVAVTGNRPPEQPVVNHNDGPVANGPLFGPDMREIGPGDELEYPLLSTCVCGRQILKQSYSRPWEYCGA